MRSKRIGMLVCLVGFAVPAWAQQLRPAAPQAASDPKAIAVVQAAITALGGAAAISQAQSWTFQAQTQGPHSNGNVDYAISTDADTGTLVRADGTTGPAPSIRSHFVPALVGAILLKESQDTDFSILYAGTSTVDAKPATIIIFAFGQGKLPAQIWYFDATNLPVRIDFRLPAAIGARESFPNVVDLLDYRRVSGILYPCRLISFPPGKPPQIVTLQAITASAEASPNEFNGLGGDLQ